MRGGTGSASVGLALHKRSSKIGVPATIGSPDLPDELSECYTRCRQIARGAASSFPRFFRLLSPPKRRGMYALYAFFRHTDDLGDNEELSLAERRRQLDSWQEAWMSCLHADSLDVEADANHRWLPAVADTVRRFSVPHQSLVDVIDGCRQDLVKQRYENFDELSGYCHLVASSVGLACMHVWEFQETSDAFDKAKSAGLAFQLTNILRDIPEDLNRQRVYLPQDEIRRFQCSEDDLSPARPLKHEKLEEFLRFQVDRAEGYFDDALGLVPHLSTEGQKIFRLMHCCYRAILIEIGNLGPGVLTKRASLSRIQLVKIVAKELCGSAALRPYFGNTRMRSGERV